VKIIVDSKIRMRDYGSQTQQQGLIMPAKKLIENEAINDYRGLPLDAARHGNLIGSIAEAWYNAKYRELNKSTPREKTFDKAI